MSDTTRKVLLGAVAGALLVLFYTHVMKERSKRDGGAQTAAAPAAGRPAGPSGFSQRPVGVVVAPVRAERLALEIEALGTARANESVEITAKVANPVTAVRFTEGQRVRRGEVLVELDGAQERAELAVAEAALVESRRQYERSRELYDTRVLSESQIEQIEATFKGNEARVAAARARLADTVVRAPFDGRVGLRRVSVGSLISPGTVITTLDDTSIIKLDFSVPESYVSAVRPGLAIRARSVAFADTDFEGKVSSVDTRVDPSTRSVTVRAELPNPTGQLKPGMFLTVRLARGTVDALLVPEEALVPEQGDVYVYVVTDGTADKRLVRLGERRVGDVQVLEGLVAGDMVVTEGTQKLRPGVAVAIQEAPPAIRQAGEPAGAAATP
ncbi:MAG: efflux RND transporter periplasmic adaptor subunit [Lysobacterales bacterium]|nr:MAG: efflux RND transporter periplasmic adaptor subunit [Xanthomonadales bacterium]